MSEDKKCLECGSENVFVEIKPSDDVTLYRCFDCYCEDYDHYINDET